jgi:outer membrane protein TolC
VFCNHRKEFCFFSRSVTIFLAGLLVMAAPLWAQLPEAGMAQVSAQSSGSSSSPQAGVGLAATVSTLPGLGGPQNPFQGSAQVSPLVPGTVPITLLDAINRGLRYNLGLYTSQTSQQTVQAARLRALANLLPNLEARAADTMQQVNLAVYGIPLPPGTPQIVGPFNVVDARALVTTPILNLQLLNKFRAANSNVDAAQFNYKDARELVVVAVGLGYVQALAAESRVEAIQAQVTTSQALYEQAKDQLQAGVTPAIDVLRAQVELQAQQERLVTAKNTLDIQKLQLARIIGLPVAQSYTLAQKIPFTPVPPLTLEDAIARALRDRPDLKAAEARVRAAEYSLRAAQSEHLPTLGVNADYGTLGRNFGNAHGTFTAAAALTVPIFEGGRIRSDIDAAQSVLNQRKAEVEDLRGRIEYEVRATFLNLDAAAEQVRVAQSSLNLAKETLSQAQDRFRAGVTNNLEVVQAQESVADSNDVFINSTLQYNLAKLALARSLGVAERAIKDFLGGTP